MKVQAHISMVFHLDKCLGCHTCSVSCKNMWTDRKGAEYMWWNNVETRPGTGYPTLWEDQDHFRGGWEFKSGKLSLRLQTRMQAIMRLFYNPNMPFIKDYYEPFTFRYKDLFTAPPGDDQPVAVPVSMISGKPIDIETGPNWDDDLGGSPIYARNDPNLKNLPEEIRTQLEHMERLVLSYLPRICNHCLNPACVAACPSGAIYKRGEDGIVLVNQERCRGWRMCISACPYKKVYYNWTSGKSEKCILCFPRLETGQPPACSHSCVGRIRFMGVLLYDADCIPGAAMVPDDELVEAHREIILDPFDPEVIAAAKKSGVDPGWMDAARHSPTYKYVKEWGVALPLHPEYRTMVMMYYVPPLTPVVSTMEGNLYRLDLTEEEYEKDLITRLDAVRLPIQYLAQLFTAGNETIIRKALATLLSVRLYMRQKETNQSTEETLAASHLTAEQIEDFYRLTVLSNMKDRFVLPPYHREMDIEASKDPLRHKGEAGFGFVQPLERRE